MGKIIEPLPHKSSWSSQNFFSWLVILLPPAIYFYLIYSYSLNLPFADDFTILSQAIRIIQSTNFSEQFSLLFASHNEHRVAFTRLAFTLSYALFGEIDFSFLIFIGNAALVALLYLFFKMLNIRHGNLIYFIPISILLFQLQFWKNMTWAASSLQHQYILLFTGLTFYLLSKKSNPGFYSAFFFAVISVFTHGGGWVTIFLGWVILLIQKRYQKGSIWAGGVLLLGFFYFKNFHSNTNVFSGIQSLEGFKNFLMFYSAFLGSSLSLDKMYIAAGFGVILSFYLCYLTWDKYFEKNITVFMFMVYIFLNAILVAMARSGLAVENVFAPRYKIVSVILIVLVYVSLAERFSPIANKFRNFVAIGVLVATVSYLVSFKPGKDNLETRTKSLTWLANQWVNTNHGFYFSPGEPGAHDRIANSKLLRAIEGRFYKLPHKILNIPDKGYSTSVTLPKTCVAEKQKTFRAKFSVIPIGPETNPYLVRLEGMIHSPIPNELDNKSAIHLILKSRDRVYIFETHPQQYLEGSVFFENQSFNAGFIALIPFEKIENGLYRIGFCYGETIRFEEKFFLKKEGRFIMANQS
jgi:hypothetical protein